MFVCAKALHGSAALAAREMAALNIGQQLLRVSAGNYVKSLDLDCAVEADDMSMSMFVQPYHREIEAVADTRNVRRLLRMLRVFMTAPPLCRRIFDSTVAQSIYVRPIGSFTRGARFACV